MLLKMFLSAVLALLALQVTASPRPLFVDVQGREMSYDASSNVFSVSGAVLARTWALGAAPGSADPTCGFCVSGYQALTATIDESGALLTGSYSLIGSAPALGLSSPTILLSASIARVDVDIPEAMGNTAGYGAFSVLIDLNTIYANPLLGDFARRLQLCCEYYHSALHPFYGSFPLTSLTKWTTSWGGLAVSDYSRIQGVDTLSSPTPLSLFIVSLTLLLVFSRGLSSRLVLSISTLVRHEASPSLKRRDPRG